MRDHVVGASRAQRLLTATRVYVRAPQLEHWPRGPAHRPLRGQRRGVAVCVQRSRVIRRQHRRDTAGGGHDAPLPWACLRPFRPGHSHVEKADSPLFCAHVKAGRFEGLVRARTRTAIDGASLTSSSAAAQTGRQGSPRLWPAKDGRRPAHGRPAKRRGQSVGSRALPPPSRGANASTQGRTGGATAADAKAAARGIACFLAWGSLVPARRRPSSRRSSEDHAAMGRERVGPDIFQSGPIIRCGARAPLCALLNTGNDGMFAGLSGGTASLRSW